ncbi:MAG: YitT family protein [Eisenbergiella massiliensis]|nr:MULTISPECIES: YitT family protein [Clostridia]MCI6706153.1 YitT family protein [Eisenbergiella massiliensis]
MWDVLADIAGGLFYALGIYTFAKTANFAPGGLSGLALITHHLWGLPIGIMTLVFNIPVILLSFRLLGKRFLFKSLRSMIVCTLFVDFLLPAVSPPYTGSPLLAALYSGIFLGAGLAVLYMRGSSSGGTDFLTMSVKVLRPHMSLGAVTMIIDLIIILMGWPVFGNIDSVLYGIVATGVTSIVIDKIMYGVGAGKLIIIISDHGQEVADKIANAIDRGSTLIRAIGTYTGSERQVLLCACNKSQAFKVRSAAHEVDENAFVMITETSEVYGEGFLEQKK